MTEKTIFVKYVGGGNSFIPGVPSCDMSESEWNAVPEDLRKLALAAGTHQLVKKQGGKPAAEVSNGTAS